MGWLGSLLSGLASLLGWGRERDARANAPAVVAAKVAARDELLEEKIARLESAAAAGDASATEELRKLISAE